MGGDGGRAARSSAGAAGGDELACTAGAGGPISDQVCRVHESLPEVGDESDK